MANPFNPAPGAAPARIVGREAELAAIDEAIRRATMRQAATPMVFVGQRGIGKTVLLRALRERGESKTLSVAVESVPDRSLAERLRDKVDDLLGSTETLAGRASAALKRALSVMPKVSYELPQDGGAFSIEGRGEDAPDRHRDSLFVMLTALNKAAAAGGRYLTVTIDEAQDADLRSMRTLTTFVHESGQGKTPVVLALAGLSSTRDLMDKLRTYVRRYDAFDLRYLTAAETIEAIRAPIVDRGHAIAEDALQLLAAESAGYPFFIAAYASAAWMHHRGSRITLDDVQKTLPEVRRRHAVGSYQRPLASLKPRELALALVLAELGPGSHTWGDVARAIDLEARDISSVRSSLERKGIITVPIPGRIEFSVPLMDRYLRENDAEYRDAAVVRAMENLRTSRARRGNRMRT